MSSLNKALRVGRFSGFPCIAQQTELMGLGDFRESSGANSSYRIKLDA